MKSIKALLLYTFFACFLMSCQSTNNEKEHIASEKGTGVSTYTSIPEVIAERDAVSFTEIWAYVLDGREETLRSNMPITDVGYFGAEIGNRGNLEGVPNTVSISHYNGRKHLVAVCNHYGMTHMVLNPEYPFRDKLIHDLLEAVALYNYDGLQIDYELVLATDKENFLSFLQELAEGLKELSSTQNVEKRIFSVAVPARTRYLSEDAFDYKRIAAIADSVFIMAYDEHWSGGTPGPVASFSWSKNVADYAIETIGINKLVMGQPFYGRTWGDTNPNRAFYFSGMERQIKEFSVENLEREENILRFSYTIPLTITGYFDDAESIFNRSIMYKNMKINKTGFWCLGQEDPKVWQKLTIKE